MYRQVLALRQRFAVDVYAAMSVNEREYDYGAVSIPLGWPFALLRRIRRRRQRAGFSLSPNRLTVAERAFLSVRACTKPQPQFAYAMFGWNAIELIDLLSLAGFKDVPVVVHLAGSDITAPRARGRGYLAALRGVFRRAHTLLCGSDFLIDVAERLGAPREKLVRHYLGIPVPPQSRVHTGAGLHLLACSRFVDVKGVLQTVEVLALASRRCPQIRLTMIGDGPLLPACKERADALGVMSSIDFIGSVRHEKVYYEMMKSSVFIQMNRVTRSGAEEAIGGTLLEAAAHGLPVIATRTGGVREAIIDGESGVLVDADDIDAAADAVVMLAGEPALRTRYGDFARKHVAENHNSEKQNEIFLDLLGRRLLLPGST